MRRHLRDYGEMASIEERDGLGCDRSNNWDDMKKTNIGKAASTVTRSAKAKQALPADTAKFSGSPNSEGTQSIGRVAALLRIVAGNTKDGLRLVDIVQRSGLETPTAHRILKGLVSENLLTRDEATRSYRLGPLLYELGLATSPPNDLLSICEVSVHRLAQLSGDVAMLAARSGADVVCLDRREGDHPVRALTVQVGTRRPLGVGAASLAILAALSEEEITRLLNVNAARFWQFNGLTPAKLRDLIRDTKANGYALTKGELFPEVGGVGMAVLGPEGQPVAGFGISTTITRLPPERVQHLVKLLHSEVAFVETQLRKATLGED